MKVTAAVVVTLALLVGAIPYFFNCEHDGKKLTLSDGRQVPMKCSWTARAETAVAAPLLVVGSLLSVSRRRESRGGLGVLGAALGAFVMLLPTQLIGVCTHPDASCNLVMKPAMLFLGVLIVGASLWTLLAAQRTAEPALERVAA